MIKTQTFPLKGGVAGIVRLVRRALSTKGIQTLTITLKGISVSREVEADGEEIVPGGSDEVDIEFLLERMNVVAHPFVPDEHGTQSLFAACGALEAAGRVPFAIVTPGWGLLSAWLGVPKAEKPPVFIYGLRLILVAPARVNGRVLVLGVPKNLELLSDADIAVSVDMGV